MLYLRVYNAIVNDIYSGKLKKGDRAPSIQAIQSDYAVSCNTARTVLQMLHDNGFIDKAPRRPSVVTFDWSVAESHCQINQMIAERKEMILDACRARSLLFPSLIATSVVQSDVGDWEEFDTICEQVGASEGAQAVENAQKLIRRMLVKLKNPLASTLLDITDLSPIIPIMLYEREKRQMQRLGHCIYEQYAATCALIRNRQYTHLKQQIYNMYKITGILLANIMDELYDPTLGPTACAQPDLRRDEHLYITVAMEILEKVGTGFYKKGEFFPGESSLAQIYGVSLYTVKRALHYLNELGAAKTYNGKGTMNLLSNPIHMPPDEIAEKIGPYLPGYFSALEILSTIVRDLGEYAAVCTSLPKIMRRDGASITKKLHHHHAFIPLNLLDLLAKCIDCGLLGNFYLCLKRNMIWGIYLITEETRGYFAPLSRMCEYAVHCADTPSLFANALEMISEQLYLSSRQACKHLKLPLPDAPHPRSV